MPFSFLIPAGASLLGSVLQSDATGDAAGLQAQGTADQIAENRRQFDLTRADYAPYRETGVNALKQLATDINGAPTAAEVMAQPGYQFGLKQGQQALDRKVASMGGRVSGAAIKSATRYATDYATTGYGAEYQRRQDRLNRLAALAGIGQTATTGSAQAGQAAANNIGSALSSQGDASAAARLAQGNIWGNAGNQIAALYGRSQSAPQANPYPYDYRGSDLPYSLRGGG